VCVCVCVRVGNDSRADLPSVARSLLVLASNSKLVAELLAKGALLYVLNVFCNSANAENRQAAAGVFSKLIADKVRARPTDRQREREK
jgi:hypothetical protein